MRSSTRRALSARVRVASALLAALALALGVGLPSLATAATTGVHTTASTPDPILPPGG